MNHWKQATPTSPLFPCLAASALIMLFALVPSTARADDSLDDLLGLEEESATENGNAEEAEGDAEADEAEPDVQVEVDLDDLALPTSEEGDVFQLAVADMKNAAERLSTGRDASIETQRVQQRAIVRLEQAISMAQQQQSESQSGGSPQDADTGSAQNQPQQQGQAGQQPGEGQEPGGEQANRGSVEQSEMEEELLEDRVSEWGDLPPRLRDELMQGMEDSFSQLYRQLTERYYERLAEQQE
ncbi:MAG: hypothetical protein WD294_10350 [Phycisphaeraceae bacterium]